jgi:hypothetical protein
MIKTPLTVRPVGSPPFVQTIATALVPKCDTLQMYFSVAKQPLAINKSKAIAMLVFIC